MTSVKACFIKVNLTLRVLHKRSDGYHDVVTAYWRLPSPDVLRIEPLGQTDDRVSLYGLPIPGAEEDNILYAACSMLRRKYPCIPPLAVDLYKHIPPGSGVGAGSGNAAALIRWFERSAYSGGTKADPRIPSALGADVAFLSGDSDLILAGGIGDVFQPAGEAPELSAAIVFPNWRSNTARAYSTLDSMRGGGGCVMTEAEAAAESYAVLNNLRLGNKVGLLPNDFILCMESRKLCYNNLYKLFDDCGAIAWGLCGSGSSSFGLFRKAEARDCQAKLASRLEGFDWIEQTLLLE